MEYCFLVCPVRRRDLRLGHLVDRFDRNDTILELVMLETRLQLALCFTRADDQDLFHIANRLDDLVVELHEFIPEASVPHVFWFAVRATRIASMSFGVGLDGLGRLAIARNRHDHGLAMIDPQTSSCCHEWLPIRWCVRRNAPRAPARRPCSHGPYRLCVRAGCRPSRASAARSSMY